MLKTKSCARL